MSTTPDQMLVKLMAPQYHMDEQSFARTVIATCMPKEANSREEFATFLMIANRHGLNPLTREIYAMWSKKAGKLSVIVGIDGWMSLINRRPEFDGMTFEDVLDKGKLVAITCRIYRKDRTHPVEVTEYLHECDQGTEPWKKWPARMLRHKAAIQCARYAFAISGIIDPDEFDRFGSDKPMKSVEGNPPEVVAKSPSSLNNNKAGAGIPPVPAIPGSVVSTARGQDLAASEPEIIGQRTREPAPPSSPEPFTIDEDGVVIEEDPRPTGNALVSEWLGRINNANYDEAILIIEREVYPAQERGQLSATESEELIQAALNRDSQWRR